MHIFSVFFNMKVCYVLSLELPRRDDCNEYTQYTIFNIKKKIPLNCPKSTAMGFFFKRFKNEYEIAVVNEPLMLEPLNVYYTNIRMHIHTYIPTYIHSIWHGRVRPRCWVIN